MSSKRHLPGAAAVPVVALGVALRLGLLLLAGALEPWADEGQYLYQALCWNHFGFYLGSPGWVWPPGYPGFLAVCFRLFGEHGIVGAKLVQVALSGVVGGSVAALAGHLFGRRAALAAAWIWALYLPLAAYTHYLWPETLFAALLVPAVLLFLRALGAGTALRAQLALAACGVLLGLTLLLKEATLPLLVLLPAILLATPRAGTLVHRVAGAATLVLATALVVAPWSLRTQHVYGRWVPSGSTLGENLWQGVNAQYVNFDYGGPDRAELSGVSVAYRLLAEAPPGAELWPRSTAVNTIDMTAENSGRARAFARRWPGFFARSRLKKLADWVSPLSFFVRHERNGVYDGVLGSRWMRAPLVLFAVGATAWLLWVGLAGLFRAVPGGAPRWTLLAVIACFLAGALVVSMSRYRLQVEPFLIVAAAGLLAAPREATVLERRLAVGALCSLAGLWLINLEELVRVLARTL